MTFLDPELATHKVNTLDGFINNLVAYLNS